MKWVIPRLTPIDFAAIAGLREAPDIAETAFESVRFELRPMKTRRGMLYTVAHTGGPDPTIDDFQNAAKGIGRELSIRVEWMAGWAMYTAAADRVAEARRLAVARGDEPPELPKPVSLEIRRDGRALLVRFNECGAAPAAGGFAGAVTDGSALWLDNRTDAVQPCRSVAPSFVHFFSCVGLSSCS